MGGVGGGGSIFDRYGGFAVVSRIVSSFYDRVLDSPTLSPYFAGIDMRRQIDHQTKFIASLMGGPASFTSEHLERVHARLHIDDRAFDEIVEVLRETLEDFDFDESDIATVYGRVVGFRSVIVTRPPAEVGALDGGR
jgi:hemoglobin